MRRSVAGALPKCAVSSYHPIHEGARLASSRIPVTHGDAGAGRRPVDPLVAGKRRSELGPGPGGLGQSRAGRFWFRAFAG